MQNCTSLPAKPFCKKKKETEGNMKNMLLFDDFVLHIYLDMILFCYWGDLFQAALMSSHAGGKIPCWRISVRDTFVFKVSLSLFHTHTISSSHLSCKY